MTRSSGTSVGPAVESEVWEALGTTAVICAWDADLAAARRAAQEEIDAIDAAASRFRPDSELSAINRAAGRWVAISSLMMEAMRLAVRAAVITGGAVDPTLGTSLRALGYDRDWALLTHVAPGTPFDPQPHRARALPGQLPPDRPWRQIELREDPPSIRIPPGVALDLGATAKGLAADRAARAAALAAGGGILVSLGGDVATAGVASPDGWAVRVTDDHRDGSSAEGQTIALGDGGLATSSLVPRRWRHGARAMHHVLDPRTGRPVAPRWRTASVAAASCAEANIASTAALVLGADAPAWIEEQGLPARLVALDGAVRSQGGWPA